VHPEKLSVRVRAICQEFNDARNALIETDPETASLDDAAYVVARLYCKLLRAHPWISPE
jgi:hypothetical protein